MVFLHASLEHFVLDLIAELHIYLCEIQTSYGHLNEKKIVQNYYLNNLVFQDE